MSTKSTRSAGTQSTKRGIAQGNVLLDPVEGLPIDVIEDLSGKRRLAVDADLTVSSAIVEVALDATTDSVRVEDPDTGAHVRVETDGSINANVKVSSTDGDSILVVGTEDGTPTGTQHNIKVDSSKNLIVKDPSSITELQTIEGKLDTLHSDNTSILSDLSTLHNDNVVIESKIDTTNSNLTTIDTDIKASQPRKLQDGLGNAITSSNNGVSSQQLLHTQTPDTTTASTTLGSLNATLQVALTGLNSAGFQLNAGTLIGTIVCESSVDGGNNWISSVFIDNSSFTSSNSLVFTSNNTLKILGLVPIGGASHIRVRVSAYSSGSATALLRASEVQSIVPTISSIISPFPAANISSDSYIFSEITFCTVYTATQKLALKQFYAAGTGIGKQTINYYNSASSQFVSYGDFESISDVNNWIYTTSGGTGILAYSTTEYFTGTGSMSLTFTSSDINHRNGALQTFSSVQDLSTWRYISAHFYNTVSAGGAYTRHIQIILTDNSTNTRTYEVTGLSTNFPFNTDGWIQILGEIFNPTSSTGTNFDATSVISIELRQYDSGNKAGTVYWDTVKLSASIQPILPIFHQSNVSLNVAIDPVIVINSGQELIICQKNNDISRQEYFALVGMVSV